MTLCLIGFIHDLGQERSMRRAAYLHACLLVGLVYSFFVFFLSGKPYKQVIVIILLSSQACIAETFSQRLKKHTASLFLMTLFRRCSTMLYCSHASFIYIHVNNDDMFLSLFLFHNWNNTCTSATQGSSSCSPLVLLLLPVPALIIERRGIERNRS